MNENDGCKFRAMAKYEKGTYHHRRMDPTIEELHLVLHFKLVPNATSQVVGSVGDP